MLTFAVALKDKGVPVPEIAKKLIIKVGKNAGKNPSVASLYRALAEAEAAAEDDGLPRRPRPVRISRPGEPLTAEELDLRAFRTSTSTSTKQDTLADNVVDCLSRDARALRNRADSVDHAAKTVRKADATRRS